MMKRFFCLLICLCLALGLPLSALAQQDENEIHIRDAQDLLSLAENCVLDSYSQGKKVSLDCDIDLTGVDFHGIPSFGGSFDGNGYTISGLEFTDTRSVVGLFRYVQPKGVIRNLKVSGQIAPGGTAATVGGICGSNRGLIADCHYVGSVAGKTNVGGIAGVNEEGGSILRCTSQGVVVGENMTGGIVGFNLGLVENCENQACVNIHTPDGSLDLSSIDLSVLMDPSALSNGITVMDTGGITGYSVGAIYDCVNTASVGYPHIGYNVGGIVGRGSGIISGCVNRGAIQGRKDVGGIVGQMEPNVSLNLSEDYLKQLETQMGELEELTRQLQTSFDRLGATNTHLNNTLTHIDGVSASLESLAGYVGTYGDSLTDEVNRASLLLQDALTQLLPVLEQAVVLSESLQTAMSTMAQSMEVLAEAADYLEVSLALMNAAMTDLNAATEQLAQGMEQISEGVQLLASSLQVSDPEQVAQALQQIESGLQQFSEAAQKAGDAAQKIADALQQQGTWDDETAAGFAEAMQALADMGEALQTMTEGFSALMDNLQFDQAAFWEGLDCFTRGMEALTDAMDSLQKAGDRLSMSMTALEMAADRGGEALEIVADAMQQLVLSLGELTRLGELLHTAVDTISRYQPIQLPKLDSGAKDATDALFDDINAISDELRSILALSDTFSQEAKQLLNAMYEKFHEMLSTAMKLTDQVLDTATNGIIKDTSDADIDAVQAGKVSLCRNEGCISADINAGGIAGAMAVEYQMDPEDDFTAQLSQHRLRTYQAKAIISQCINSASIQGKRSYMGGICGRMDLGIIVDCCAFGSVSSTDGDFVGGIAGSAAGPIRACGVKTDLSGGKYVGGVAGLATEVEHCRTLVQMSGREFVGAILGYAEIADLEQILANLYFALPDSPGAIDGISYDGCAQSAQWDEFMNSPVTQQNFDMAELTFCFADGTEQTLILPVGTVLEEDMLPQLQNTAQHIHYWEGAQAQLGKAQYFSRRFAEISKAMTVALESQQTRPDGKPIVLLQGSFLGTEKVQLQPLTDLPEALEGWSFAVPEGGKVTCLRYAIPQGQEQVQILIRLSNGTLQPVSHTVSGSYAVFSVEEGVTAFYVTVPAGNDGLTIWICIAAAVLAVGIAGILLLRRKKKKTR